MPHFAFKENTIHVANRWWGTSFEATEMRLLVLEKIKEEKEVILDFTNTPGITARFADEAIAKLMFEELHHADDLYQKKITIKGTTKTLMVMKRAFFDRLEKVQNSNDSQKNVYWKRALNLQEALVYTS